MRAGDRVVLKDRPEVTGTVTEVQHDVFKGLRAHVRYDGDWIPHEDWHELEYLELIQSGLNDLKNCTCGVKFIRDGGLHSDWCDLVRR